jgi:SagB-type dehydrogenase family enzyme
MTTIPLNLVTDTVDLPPPRLGAGLTLQAAFQARRSTRKFLADPLSLEHLSAILWAACGLNRPQQGSRTAPSAHNWQEISVLAVLAKGTYRYEAREHRLLLVKAEDLRPLTGLQDFVASASLNLVYVADFARMHDTRADERDFFVGADAGCIAQNVSLYCAAAGLGTVVRGLIDRRALAVALGLMPTERIALAQTVGYAAAQ